MNQTKDTGLLGAITSWMTEPFNASGSAFNWILFVGLLVIAAWLWNTVLLALAKPFSEVV